MTRPVQLVAVLLVAAAAVSAVLGITIMTRDTPHQPAVQSGTPPIPKTLPGPEGAAIEAAYETWPKGSIDAMQRLAQQYPQSALVHLYRGIALLWSGFTFDAQTALERAKSLGRDTQIEIQADDFLHPQFNIGYPIFEPTPPTGLLEEGTKLQAQGHQRSASKLFDKAAKLTPNDDQAQVAAAVGHFDKGDLNASFSRLGPLTKRFPQSQVVRYYIGLLLVWTGQFDQAVIEFKKAVAIDATSKRGRASQFLLDKLTGKPAATTTTG
ncbi:MAG: hypothetical protein WCH31_05060 [Actinomycetes bacterium]